MLGRILWRASLPSAQIFYISSGRRRSKVRGVPGLTMPLAVRFRAYRHFPSFLQLLSLPHKYICDNDAFTMIGWQCL